MARARWLISVMGVVGVSLSGSAFGQQPNTTQATAIWAGWNTAPWPRQVSLWGQTSLTYSVTGAPNQGFALVQAPAGVMQGALVTATELGERCAQVSLVLENAGEIAMRLGKLRGHADGVTEELGRRVQKPMASEAVPDVVADACVGLQAQRLAIGGSGRPSRRRPSSSATSRRDTGAGRPWRRCSPRSPERSHAPAG
jgi:hypothetical protein